MFDPIIQEYHGIRPDAKHTSNMQPSKYFPIFYILYTFYYSYSVVVISTSTYSTCSATFWCVQATRQCGRGRPGPFCPNPRWPLHRRVWPLAGHHEGPAPPGEPRSQVFLVPQLPVQVEALMRTAFSRLTGDLAGSYFALGGLTQQDRQQLVDDHFLFVSGDRNLQAAGMERDWPEGRGIFHNKEKTFLVWVNEEDQLRIISMQKGGDVKAVFERLAQGIKAVQESVNAESGKDFMLDPKYGYIHSCPTNLGTGMRASVHVDLPGWTKAGLYALQCRSVLCVACPTNVDARLVQVRGAGAAAPRHQGGVRRPDRRHV